MKIFTSFFKWTTTSFGVRWLAHKNKSTDACHIYHCHVASCSFRSCAQLVLQKSYTPYNLSEAGVGNHSLHSHRGIVNLLNVCPHGAIVNLHTEPSVVLTQCMSAWSYCGLPQPIEMLPIASLNPVWCCQLPQPSVVLIQWCPHRANLSQPSLWWSSVSP